MSTTIAEVILSLNVATNHIASQLLQLRAVLANGDPVTPGQLAELDAIAARLESLASDPANPVP